MAKPVRGSLGQSPQPKVREIRRAGAPPANFAYARTKADAARMKAQQALKGGIEDNKLDDLTVVQNSDMLFFF